MKHQHLLEFLQQSIGCAYLSDLRYMPWKLQAKVAIQACSPEEFPLSEWMDACHYFWGDTRPRTTAKEIRAYMMERM